MSLDAGSIVVDADGNATGTGLALFNGALSSLATDRRQLIAEAIAPFFQGMAAAIVTHLTANAEVQVTISPATTGLQTSTAVGTPTGGPSASRTLTGGIA